MGVWTLTLVCVCVCGASCVQDKTGKGASASVTPPASRSSTGAADTHAMISLAGRLALLPLLPSGPPAQHGPQCCG